MKKASILFVLAVLLVFSISVSVSASNGFEFIGGGIYTTVDSDFLNNVTKNVNYLFKGIQNETDLQLSISEMDEINSGFGLYVGGLLPLNRNFKIGGYYERLNFSSEGNLKSPLINREEIEVSIGLPVNGVVGTAVLNINDFISLNGGVGYYFGGYNTRLTCFENGIEVEVPNLTLDETVDVSGIGFNFGANIDYPINEQMSIIGGANYRILSLAPKDEDKYGDNEIDLDGFEFRGGIAYKF